MKYKSLWFFFFLILLLPLPSLSASFTVDSLADEADTDLTDSVCAASSGCTLRAAIQQANALGETTTITFSVNGTITLSLTGTGEDDAVDGDLDIKSNLTLQGNGTSSTVITQSGIAERIFHIPSSGLSVTFQNIRITGGYSSNDDTGKGAGIFNEGAANLTITDSQIDLNESEESGGGLFSDGGALVISGSTISDNVSNGGAGIFANGGTFSMSGSTVSGNRAYEGGGGLVLYLMTGTVNISGSTITSNLGSTLVGGIGAVGTTVNLDTSTVSNNYALIVGGIGSYYANWTITNSTVSGNIALNSPSGTVDCWDGSVTIDHIGTADCIGGQGGGISDLLVGQSTYVITNSTISGNSSADYGGGVLLLTDSSMTLNNVTVANNAGTNVGGGIYSKDAILVLRNTLLAGNSASASADCYGSLTLGHYNLLGDQSGCSPTANDTDLVGDSASSVGIVDPKLRDLADNGGVTHTHGLYSTSPALDAGNSTSDGCSDGSGALTKDQRDATRPIDGNADGQSICDIGSYEYDPNSAVDQAAEAALVPTDDTQEESVIEESIDESSASVVSDVMNGIISGGAIADLFNCTLSPTREPIHSPLGLVFILGNVALFCVLRRRVKVRARHPRSKW